MLPTNKTEMEIIKIACKYKRYINKKLIIDELKISRPTTKKYIDILIQKGWLSKSSIYFKINYEKLKKEGILK